MAVDLEKLRKKYEELKKRSSGDADWMTLEDGDNLVRFLSDEEGNFYHETGYHYVKQGKDKVAVVCNRLDSGEPCYICDIVDSLYKSKDKSDKELAKELSAKSRIFFNVIDRSDGKVKVLGTGNQIFKELLKYFADDDWGDLTDAKTGRDVVINKSGSGLDTEYSVIPKPNTSKLKEEVELKDLSSISKPFTYEEQELVMDGMSPEDVFKRREEAESKSEPKKGTNTEESKKAPPTRKPKQEKPMTPEEIYADKIALIDTDIPKAVKLLNSWLEDDTRTEEELDQIIEKYGKEDTEPESSTSDGESSEESKEEDLDDAVAKALSKFKKNK